jgi:chromosome segregation ATPase
VSKRKFVSKSPLLFWLNDQACFAVATIVVAIALGLIITQNVNNSLTMGLVAVAAAYGGNLAREKRLRSGQKKLKMALAKEIWRLEERLENLENYEDKLYQAIGSAQIFHQNMETENNQLRTERFYLVDHISNLHQRRDEFYQLFAQLQPQKQKLETVLADLSHKIEQANYQKESLEKRLVETNYNMKLIENSCDFIREELEQLQNDILKKAQYKEELKQEIQELEKKTSLRANNLDELMIAENHLQSEVNNFIQSKIELEQKCQNLQNNLDIYNQENSRLIQTLSEKRREIHSLETCLSYLKNEYDYLQTDVLEAQNQVVILTEYQQQMITRKD